MSKRSYRQRVHLLIAFVLLTAVYYYSGVVPLIQPSSVYLRPSRAYLGSRNSGAVNVPLVAVSPKNRDDDSVEMVVASLKREDTAWLNDYLLDWKKNIYLVDDSDAKLSVPENKGRETMVYLTYIIDRYDSLPANSLFHHAGRFQWHNDNPDYDALTLLQRLRLGHIMEQGYVNLRCSWILGCPAEIKPVVDATEPVPGEPVTAKRVYKKAFEELFPGETVPETVAVPCCSQFAVRRETIRRRPKSDYVRYRDWLLETDLPDMLSGRVFEYAWHIIFGKAAVHCPDAAMCYCNLYGLCHMACDEKRCEGQYTLPPFSDLPEGWPRVGWKNEDRHWSGPE